METALNTAIVVFTFFTMEGAAWFTHKYIMHGVGWYFHRDHHVHPPGFFEKNDVFFLIFAIPSWLFTMTGMMHGNDWKLWVGVGIALYGIAYFLVHEVFIHQRIRWFRQSRHPYFRAIRKAHYTHHRNTGKENGVCFGMLWVPVKYLRAEYKTRKTAS
jgi:beta-carotene 3-hydroxylase